MTVEQQNEEEDGPTNLEAWGLREKNLNLIKMLKDDGLTNAEIEKIQEESNKKYERLQADFETQREAEADCRRDLEASRSMIQTIQKKIKGEQERAVSCQRQLETIQKKNQQLKGERNSYKQKNESLSKEVARLCRGGKNIRDIEKVLADHEALKQETDLLRAQKRRALEDAHKYRVLHEQSVAAREVLASGQPNEAEG